MAIATCLLLVWTSCSPAASLQVDRFTPHAIAELPVGLEEPKATTWTDDGLEVAYIALRGEDRVACVNDRELGEWNLIATPTVGPRAGDVAFRVRSGSFETGRWSVIREGHKPVEHKWIGQPVFSPDGKRLVYWTEPDKVRQVGRSKATQTVVLEGAGGKSRPWVGVNKTIPPAFSRDGKSVYSIVESEDGWAVLRSGRSKEQTVGVALQDVLQLTLSPKGNQWTQAGTLKVHKKKGTSTSTRYYQCLMRGKKILHQDDPKPGASVYSPDGRHLAYKLSHQKRMCIGLDGELVSLTSAGFVTSPVWRPDSRRLAYVSHEIETKWNGSTPRRSSDSREREGPDMIHTLSLKGEVNVLAGPFDRVEKLTWSPDGSALAYAERRDGKWFVVCGDSETGPFDEVGSLHFDEEGARIAFGVRRDREFAWEVVPSQR